MIEVKQILVGVEVRPRTGAIPLGSQTAFDQACRLAENTGAQLTILHSLWHAGELWPLSEKGQAALHALRDSAAGRGVATVLEITEERAWVALCLAAKHGLADLVVLGRRDKEGAESKGRPVGSVGAKVLRSCPAPVWVVKAAHDLEHKLVLAAVDSSKVGNQVLEHAAFLARRTGAALHVVHAYSIPRELMLQAGELDKDEYDARVEALKAQAQSELDERLLRVELTESATTHLIRKSPHDAIKEAVEHLQPDVLVMGSLSRGGRPGYQLGETAERLFGQLECSVLSLKPSDFQCPLEDPDPVS
ncbi:MAG: universal stress protein [Planctomycetes bacterium]|nr:universal stress protein [Planctomycetota bacterium]MCB9908764.1 universal stress protein [Planctomycetota bacterium]MCB9912411.1 universal stress protein [Planctomycetota bacterium]